MAAIEGNNGVMNVEALSVRWRLSAQHFRNMFLDRIKGFCAAGSADAGCGVQAGEIVPKGGPDGGDGGRGGDGFCGGSECR